MMSGMGIDGSWRSIEGWLRGNAPASYLSLPESAEDAVIEAAQQACGVAFPSDLVLSLRRHDGSGGFSLPGNYVLFSAAEIATTHVDHRVREAATPAESRYWHPTWLPIAGNGAGNYLFLDGSAGENFGRVGTHWHGDGGSLEPQPYFASLTSLLDEAARGLSSGSAENWIEYVPTVDEEGDLLWEDPDAQMDGTTIVWDMAELRRRFGSL